jgi:hypothetical protein
MIAHDIIHEPNSAGLMAQSSILWNEGASSRSFLQFVEKLDTQPATVQG